ncbi:hypothetical protein SteCoe_6424 [Stentor coeruleus]|uniref:Uncharacterized protein n=1 Tax=Stentor coeruleus TaxID=5963 RepID=A0A1R2CPY4_9CILI|nr:hypothetical protein SteCoe_6424 [Stentor coeruleus]
MNNQNTSNSFHVINARVAKEFKCYEPNGASKRTLCTIPQNYDKAYEEMQTMQYKYDQEREKIRLKLNFPVVNRKKSSKALKSERILKLKPDISKILKKHTLSPEKINETNRNLKKSPREFKNIDKIVENCRELGRQNKLMLKHYPIVEKEAENSYREFNDIFEALRSFSPGNRLIDCLHIKKSFEKAEKSVLFPQRNGIRSVIRFNKLQRNDSMKKLQIEKSLERLNTPRTRSPIF